MPVSESNPGDVSSRGRQIPTVADGQDLGTDLELARRAAEGSESAWREIYERTCDSLFSLLYYQVGNREEALDLLQETYLQALRRLCDYRNEAPIHAWLRVIALRKAIDWKRTALRRLKKTVLLTENLVKVDPPARDLRTRTESAALQGALASLSRLQRAALLLREWEGWSFREIARTLRCKESTARVHHTRARARLRKLLGSRSPAPRTEKEGQRR